MRCANEPMGLYIDGGPWTNPARVSVSPGVHALEATLPKPVIPAQAAKELSSASATTPQPGGVFCVLLAHACAVFVRSSRGRAVLLALRERHGYVIKAGYRPAAIPKYFKCYAESDYRRIFLFFFFFSPFFLVQHRLWEFTCLTSV